VMGKQAVASGRGKRGLAGRVKGAQAIPGGREGHRRALPAPRNTAEAGITREETPILFDPHVKRNSERIKPKAQPLPPGFLAIGR